MSWNDDNLKKIYKEEKLPEVKFTVEKILTVSDMDDIFTTAVESGCDGIGYWACLDNTTPEWKKAKEQIKAAGADCYCGTIMTKVLLNGDYVTFIDAEADIDMPGSDEVWFLDMERFQRGCQLYEENRGSLSKCLEDGDFDAVEADCFMQYALFGDIIFG